MQQRIKREANRRGAIVVANGVTAQRQGYRCDCDDAIDRGLRCRFVSIPHASERCPTAHPPPFPHAMWSWNVRNGMRVRSRRTLACARMKLSNKSRCTMCGDGLRVDARVCARARGARRVASRKECLRRRVKAAYGDNQPRTSAEFASFNAPIVVIQAKSPARLGRARTAQDRGRDLRAIRASPGSAAFSSGRGRSCRCDASKAKNVGAECSPTNLRGAHMERRCAGPDYAPQRGGAGMMCDR